MCGDYMDYENIKENIKNWILGEGVKLVFALFVLYLIFKIVNFISNKIEKKLKNSKKRIDEAIVRVSVSVIRKGLKFIAFVCFLGYVGIETTSIAAAITSTGLALGLALQGSLSNFAGGVIILVMKPFKIGDYIDCSGGSGTVEDIKLFYTYITTIDYKVIVVPNGKMVDSSIVNYSSKKKRRLDLLFSVSYKSDVSKVRDCILSCVYKYENYLKEPMPSVSVESSNNKEIEMILKVWVKGELYWDLYYYLQEEVRKQFTINNIETTYNQMEVYIENK